MHRAYLVQSPVRNALLGSLVRTLLIQVQKTKVRDPFRYTVRTDRSLDRPLALPALARPPPSLPTAHFRLRWCCSKRADLLRPRRVATQGLARREAGQGPKEAIFQRPQVSYLYLTTERIYCPHRDIERLLLTSPKHGEELSDRGRGLLIVSVSGMRSWAAGLSGSNREVYRSLF